MGPTQNYDDPTLGVWRARPALAVVVRVVVVVLPVLLGIAVALVVQALVAVAVPVGVVPWAVQTTAMVILSGLAALVVGRATRRLLPLVSLLRLSLVFPDRVPSRFAVAVRTHSPRVLDRRIEQVRRTGVLSEQDLSAIRLLELVGELDRHDSQTRGHGERVQGYATLIGERLGLGGQDGAMLGWVALLHDIGKLAVPEEILLKTSRPTEEEWHALAAHPELGAALVEPLRGWLGPWLEAVGQHHERWDGRGYPAGLAGTQISLAARIVAVADTFDVITSRRPYKEPLSPAAARDEIRRCAGSQFDPTVVRAFLEVGLRPLEKVAVPWSLVPWVPALHSGPADALAGLSGGPLGALPGALVAAVVTGLVALGAPASAEPSPAAGPTAVPVTATTRSTATMPAGQPAGPTPLSDPVVAPDAPPVGPTATAPSTGPGPDATSAPVAGPAAAAAPAPVTDPGPPVAPTVVCAAVRTNASAGTNADLHGCDLSGATLSGSFTLANLAGADLRGATLSGTFTSADLTGARLAGATITGRLVGADLSRADLTGAVVHDADLTRVVLVGADLTRAALADRTTLRSAVGTPSSVAGATWDDVVCPSGARGSVPCF